MKTASAAKFYVVPQSAIEEVLVTQVWAQQQVQILLKQCEELSQGLPTGQVETKTFRDFCTSLAHKTYAALNHFRRDYNSAFSPNPEMMGSKRMCHLPRFGLETKHRRRMLPWSLRTVSPQNSALVLTVADTENAFKTCDRWHEDATHICTMVMALGELVIAKPERIMPKLAQIFAKLNCGAWRESLQTKLWLVEGIGIKWADVETAALGGFA